MELDHILAVVDAPLKRWQIPQSFHRTKTWSREKIASRSGTSSRLASLLSVLALFLERPDLKDALRLPLYSQFF
jgi:hypothetical protein